MPRVWSMEPRGSMAASLDPMWLITKYGFYSVVQHRDKPETMLIRSRLRSDLLELVERLPKTIEKPKIQKTPMADYPFRLEMAADDLGWLMGQMPTEDIDYPNFKDEVAKIDPHRSHLLLDVWSTLRGLELPRFGSQPRQPRRTAK